jgi:hypothetical protein
MASQQSKVRIPDEIALMLAPKHGFPTYSGMTVALRRPEWTVPLPVR